MSRLKNIARGASTPHAKTPYLDFVNGSSRPARGDRINERLPIDENSYFPENR
jgi:hypothetical protein